MNIIDLTEEHKKLLSLCLEDWSEEAKEAGPRRGLWYERLKDRGLRVKLAVDNAGAVGGMIQYLPIEHSHVGGEGLYFIPCIWVHGHKKGRGDFQKKGMGAALLKAAEEDVRKAGAGGIAAWGLWLPFWMRASWFRKHGFVKADRDGLMLLLWKRFKEDARPPRWLKGGSRKPEVEPGKVTVTGLVSGWCLGYNLAFERARQAAAEFPGRVVFREVDTSARSVVEEWGCADALFIDGRKVRTGPPPSYEKIRRLIEKRVRRL